MLPTFEAELNWARLQMPRLRKTLATLPDLSGIRLACSMHLDLKMVPLIEGLLERGAALYLTTCNPSTVRDEVVEYLSGQTPLSNITVNAYYNMSAAAFSQAHQAALDWQPSHLCEMGAELSLAFLQRSTENRPKVRASMEATGSGISRLGQRGIELPYPVFNWDDLPIKEGFSNRHMVGISTWHAFFERTHLTLHGKQVAVIGYGSVGKGLAFAGRAYGGTVSVVEPDPVRALEASYEGWPVLNLEEALARAQVVVTATGARGVIRQEHLALLQDGVFLLNVGHLPHEIEVAALYAYPHHQVLPYLEAIKLGERTIYLLAGGSMANLSAGQGDSLNAFDLTLAVMTAAIRHITGNGEQAPNGVQLLPRLVWEGSLL